jgi:hypothetical protein
LINHRRRGSSKSPVSREPPDDQPEGGWGSFPTRMTT